MGRNIRDTGPLARGFCGMAVDKLVDRYEVVTGKHSIINMRNNDVEHEILNQTNNFDQPFLRISS